MKRQFGMFLLMIKDPYRLRPCIQASRITLEKTTVLLTIKVVTKMKVLIVSSVTTIIYPNNSSHYHN